jgi:hypothetical protein
MYQQQVCLFRMLRMIIILQQIISCVSITNCCMLQGINEAGMLEALAGVPQRLEAGADSIAGVEADVAYAEKLMGVWVRPPARVQKAVQQARTQISAAKISSNS